MSNSNSANRMGTMPVKNLLISMGIPIILSMMLQAVYNIVDSAFVANIPDVGESALNALTLAFPVQMLMVAISIGTGVGTNALLAKSLGEGKQEKASKVAGNSIFLCIVIFIVFLLFGIFGAEAYIKSQTKNDLISGLAIDYIKICCILSMGIVFFSIFEKLLQATGRSVYSTISQVTGAVINIILDPILIFGYFGLPAFGVKGAAYATVIGQIASCLVGLFCHLKYNKEIKNGLSYMKPDLKIIGRIYSIGLPAIIAQAITSVMTYFLNIIFVQINESVVTAYGLFYKIQQFILFAAFGLRDSITPVISFNHGMHSKSRVNEAIRYGMMYTLAIMLIGLVALELFAPQFASLFDLSGQTQSYCIDAMRIVSLSFLCAGANVAFQGIFQALDSGLESLVISLCRQFVFVIPVAWGFSLIAKQNSDLTWLIWITFFIAETLSMLIAMVFMKKIRKHKINILQS